MTELLRLEGIGKSFFGVSVLADVDLALDAGSVLGLVGENGAGKSTLMNVLGGVLPPDAGHMTLEGEPYAPRLPAEASARGVAFIHQELNLFSNLAIDENLFLGELPLRRLGSLRLPLVDRGAARRAARSALRAVGLDVPPSTLVGDLSPGERQLVEIARAVAADARLIIFDEPTTSLTTRECERLFELIGRLRDDGRGVIYISHALSDVFRLCGRVVVLRDGRVVGQAESSELSVERAIELMVGRDMRQLYPPRGRADGGEPLLEVSGLSRAGALADVSLEVRAGEVVGLAGLMGSGRTELARALFGLDPRDGGVVRVRGRELAGGAPRAAIAAGLAYVTEDRRHEGLLMDADAPSNMALAALEMFSGRGGLIDGRRLTAAVTKVATSVRLAGAGLERQVARTLSGGNQQKVVLARWLLRGGDVYILDEPTRGVDVGARYELYTIINELVARGAGVLLISSELEELIGMCDRILVMRRGEIVASQEREAFDSEAILRAALGGGRGTS